MTCPLCSGPAVKAIYMGAPMRLCTDEDCRCAWGIGSWLAAYIPVGTEDERGDDAFAFFIYEGWYLPALYRWLLAEE